MLIAALGNIGRQYETTRHNFGFLLADAFIEHCQRENFRVDEISANKFKAIAYKITIPTKLKNGKNQFYIVKPQTYMNLSGESVQPFMAWHNIIPDNLLVLHDELDIPFDDIRLKTGGGLAGHNGLKSISERLSTKDFHRLRLGIGRPEDKEQMSGYVLSQFRKEEFDKIPEIFDKAIENIMLFLNKSENEKLK